MFDEGTMIVAALLPGGYMTHIKNIPMKQMEIFFLLYMDSR